MAKHVVAPEPWDGLGRSVFLAGGISGCPDWQQPLSQALDDLDVVIVNPRRPEYPDDPAEAEVQIRWEHRQLRRVELISFWFPSETLCPITLFELGAVSVLPDQAVVVGCDSRYQRRLDVLVQLTLARPDVRVVGDLVELEAAVRSHFA